MPTNLLGHAPASQWRQAMIDGVRFDAVTVVDVLDHVTMSIQTDAPGGLILTVNTEEQAWARARASELNKGGDAARAALAMLRIKRRLAQA